VKFLHFKSTISLE